MATAESTLLLRSGRRRSFVVRCVVRGVLALKVQCRSHRLPRLFFKPTALGLEVTFSRQTTRCVCRGRMAKSREREYSRGRQQQTRCRGKFRRVPGKKRHINFNKTSLSCCESPGVHTSWFDVLSLSPSRGFGAGYEIQERSPLPGVCCYRCVCYRCCQLDSFAQRAAVHTYLCMYQCACTSDGAYRGRGER